MPMADLGDLCLHYQLDGEPDGAPLVLIHALGTDLRLWDKVVPLLAPGLRVLRFSLRGHGLSDAPPAPYAMGALIRDAERLMDHLALRDAVVVGLSIGGMVAQGLAVKRLDLVRALVLSNTAAKIGTAETWAQRIAVIEAQGIEAVADAHAGTLVPAHVPRHARGAALAQHAHAHPAGGLYGLRGGHRRDGFLHHDGQLAPAGAGDRGQRRWLDPTRSGARNGGSGAGIPLCADPRGGASGLRR